LAFIGGSDLCCGLKSKHQPVMRFYADSLFFILNDGLSVGVILVHLRTKTLHRTNIPDVSPVFFLENLPGKIARTEG
jgi:hypothetical protein